MLKPFKYILILIRPIMLITSMGERHAQYTTRTINKLRLWQTFCSPSKENLVEPKLQNYDAAETKSASRDLSGPSKAMALLV